MKQIIVALGIVVKDGKFLITLRNDPKNPEVDHKWEIPGGGVETGETIQEAVIREVKEEVGLSVELLSFPPIRMRISKTHPHNTEKVTLNFYGFICKIVEGAIKLDNKEAIEYRWTTIAELKNLDYLSKTDWLLEEASRMLKNKLVF